MPDFQLKYTKNEVFIITRPMYRKVGQPDTAPENFELPLNGQLSPDNRSRCDS